MLRWNMIESYKDIESGYLSWTEPVSPLVKDSWDLTRDQRSAKSLPDAELQNPIHQRDVSLGTCMAPQSIYIAENGPEDSGNGKVYAFSTRFWIIWGDNDQPLTLTVVSSIHAGFAAEQLFESGCPGAQGSAPLRTEQSTEMFPAGFPAGFPCFQRCFVDLRKKTLLFWPAMASASAKSIPNLKATRLRMATWKRRCESVVKKLKSVGFVWKNGATKAHRWSGFSQSLACQVCHVRFFFENKACCWSNVP